MYFSCEVSILNKANFPQKRVKKCNFWTRLYWFLRTLNAHRTFLNRPARKKQVTVKGRTTWLMWAFSHQHRIEKIHDTDGILLPTRWKENKKLRLLYPVKVSFKWKGKPKICSGLKKSYQTGRMKPSLRKDLFPQRDKWIQDKAKEYRWAENIHMLRRQ